LNYLFKKITIFAVFVAVFGGIFYLFYFKQDKHNEAFAGAADNLSGWAWSENIGWISFNSTNCDANDDGISDGTPAGCPPAGQTYSKYGAGVDVNGLMSGYVWTENIGWITFDSSKLSGCPSGTCEARMSHLNGEVSGWARACAGTVNGDACTGGSRTDGWDGWIHLRGSNYGVSASSSGWDGYAWGSEVVGWIHFKGTNYGVKCVGFACYASFNYNLANSGNITVIKGNSGSNTINLALLIGVTQEITLSASSLPSGVSASFSPDNKCSPTCSRTFNVSVSSGATAGTYPVTISGNPLGKTTGFNLIINEPAPPAGNIVSFTANPSSISRGGSSTLSWSTSGFSSCSIDQGIGSVAVNGTYIISSQTTKVYTLTCNPGSVSRSVTVNVMGIPRWCEVVPLAKYMPNCRP